MEQSGKINLRHSGIIDASAGTGKTYNIAGIYLALLLGKESYDPEGEGDESKKVDVPKLREILVVTFTKAATAELSSRLRKRIQEELEPSEKENKKGEPPKKRKPLTDSEKVRLRLALADFDDAQISTIHGFCTRILKEFDLECGIPATAEFGSEVSKERKRFAQQFLNRERLKGQPASELMDAELLSNLIAEREKVPELVFEDKKKGELAQEAFMEWQKLRAEGDSVSYNEMLTRLLGALEKDGTLAKKIAARYKVALVDEFQDTDPLQWEIFKRIFIKNGVPFFCVGDPKQAIYKFRGGDVATYRSACEEIREVSEGNGLTLRKNRRSSPELIAAFNEIFRNDENLEIAPGEEKFSILEYKDAEAAPGKPPVTDKPAIFLRVGYKDTNKENVRKPIKETLVGDMKKVVKLIKEKEEKEEKEEKKEKKMSLGRIAILVRTNKTGREYQKALAEADIPATSTASGSVLKSSEAGDFEVLMDALLSPNDLSKVARAALTPFFGDYFKDAFLARESQKEDAGAKLQKLQEELYTQKLRWEKEKVGFVAAFAGIANAFQCFEKLAKGENSLRKITNVRHLLELINDRERRKKLTPSGLVRDFRQWRSEASEENDTLQLRTETDEDAVCIQTIYKSKGLEYDFVFLPDLWDNNVTDVPNKNSFVRTKGVNDPHHLYLHATGAAGEKKGKKEKKNAEGEENKEQSEEDLFKRALRDETAKSEATLFYVALTRAKRACVIYHALIETKKGSNESKLNSYAEALFKKGEFLDVGTHGHVQTLNYSEELPALPGCGTVPHSLSLSKGGDHDVCPALAIGAGNKHLGEAGAVSREATQSPAASPPAPDRKKILNAVRARTSKDAFGVSSFSKILGKNESISTERHGEDENKSNSSLESSEGDEQEKHYYDKTKWYDLGAGTQFGTVVHEIFERVFKQGASSDFSKIVEWEAKKFPNFSSKLEEEKTEKERKNDEEILEKLRLMVEATLKNKEACAGTTLSRIPPEDCICEMEFYFPVEKSEDLYAELNECLTEFDGVYEQTAKRHFNAKNHFPIDGFMTGFIDLVARVGEQYFVIDWKTNRIVGKDEDNATLSQARLEHEMVEHGYALQGLIYALALRSFLKRVYGGKYDHAKHFGGVSFFFVRWNKVYPCEIEERMLDKLERLICKRGTQQDLTGK